MSLSHRRLVASMITFALALLASDPGQARADLITVTFDSLPADFGPIATYTEKGFTVTGIGSTHFFTVTNPDNLTTAASFFQTDGVPMGFNFGGAPFNLISIDVPNISGQAIFLSPLGAMATITEADQHKTVFFGPGFDGITSFQLMEIAPPLSGFEGFIVVDNIAFVGPVPEPAGFVLFAGGAVGVIAYGWRGHGRKK
jgi:hypothetical protein